MVKTLRKLTNKWKVKKGDTVLVRAGKDKGNRGKVLVMFPKEGKLVVEGANLVKKHIRPRRAGEKGQVVEVPAPMPVARAMVVCPSCSKPTRVGIRRTDSEGGKSSRERICKKCSAVIA